MNSRFALFHRILDAEAFTSKALVTLAMIITVLFTISNIIGLKEYTSFLSGTSANIHLSWETVAFLGCVHLLLYLGFILLVPIFLIAAGLLLAWKYWRKNSHGNNQTMNK